MQDRDLMKAMLTYKRPAGSPTQLEFNERFLKPLGVETDPFGNVFKIIGDKPSILWSSHTDTVHRGEGGGRQNVEFNDDYFYLPKGSKASCLGADCAAGVFVMIRMIEAKVPGLYVFHYGEERGCIGSKAIVAQAPSFLDGIKAAIAFDRRGLDSIITMQGVRTCSDAFANSMAAQMPGFKLDPTGLLTDTKQYRDIVPECTNISVGYFHEHTSNEYLDFLHLRKLTELMLNIDPSKFVIERDPKVVPISPKGNYGFGSSSRWSGRQSRLFSDLEADGYDLEPQDLEELIEMYPKDTAAVLRDRGITYIDLIHEVTGRRSARLARHALTN